MSTWQGWNSGDNSSSQANRDRQLNAWGIQENVEVKTEEIDFTDIDQKPLNPNAWGNEEDESSIMDVSPAPTDSFQPSVNSWHQPAPQAMDIKLEEPLAPAGTWARHIQEAYEEKPQIGTPFPGVKQEQWEGNSTGAGPSGSISSQPPFRPHSLQNMPPREEPTRRPFLGVPHGGITLDRVNDLLRNPLLKPANIREHFFGADKSDLMQNALDRYRGVEEQDEAAELRRRIRERNRPKHRNYIPFRKMARKFAGPAPPSRRVPGPQPTDPSVSQAKREKDVKLRDSGAAAVPTRGRFVRKPMGRELQFIPLGMPQRSKPPSQPEPGRMEDSSGIESEEEIVEEEVKVAEVEPSELDSSELDLSVSADIDEMANQMGDSHIEANRIYRWNVARDCSYPNPKSGLVDLSAWHVTEGEVGCVPQTCLCAVEPESLMSEAMRKMLSESDATAVKRLLGQKMCCATYRDKQRLLNGCISLLDEEALRNQLVQWLPQRGAFAFFCGNHASLLRSHKICPYCNEFYEAGNRDFVVCRSVPKETHLYHLDCQIKMRLLDQCPHCLDDRRSVIKEWYNGSNSVSVMEKGTGYDELFDEHEFRDDEIIPLTVKGGQGMGYSGYVSEVDRKELKGKPIGCASKEDMVKMLPELNFAVLLAVKDQFPDLLKTTLANGDNLLHVAARLGKVCATVFLQSCGLPVDGVNAEGETPLITGARHNHANIVYCLIEMRANLNKQDKSGRSASHWAALQQNCGMMEYLHVNGCNPKLTDNLGFVSIFYTLTWITKPQFYSLACACFGLMHLDRDGWSLMHWSAFLHRNDLISLFFDLNLAFVGDKWGETPVHVAVRVGNMDLVQQLLEARPPLMVKVENKLSLSPFRLAEQLSEECQNPEIQRKAEEMANLMIRLMPPEFTIGIRETRSSARSKDILSTRGRVCGDISRGRNIVPIPCYNYVTDQAYPHDLIYSNVVVRPIIYQQNPAAQPEVPACKLPSAAQNCHVAKCRTCQLPNRSYWAWVWKKKKKNQREFIVERHTMIKQACPVAGGCSQLCRANGKAHYVGSAVGDCYVPLSPDEPVKLLVPAKSRPTAQHIHALQRRLLEGAALQPDLAVDLGHISDLTEIAYPHCGVRRGRARCRNGRDDRVKRSRSTGSVDGRPKRQLAVAVWDGERCKRRLRSRSLDLSRESRWMMLGGFDSDDCEVIFRHCLPKSGKLLRSTRSSHAPSSISSTTSTESSTNKLDLFDEIERFDFPFLITAAVVHFERIWHFQRWDISSLYRDGPEKRRVPGSGEKGLDCTEYTMLRGCSVKCSCGPDCCNRIWQQPSRARLALVYVDPVVEWGVLALTEIARGQFVCEYTGELVYGNLYGNDTYLYELNIANLEMPVEDEKKKKTERNGWVVDAKKVGNIGRFLNHSCLPNVKTLEVHEHGMVIPRLCMVALRTIYPGEYVTVDYGDGWWKAKRGNDHKIACRCGEGKDCKFSGPFKPTPKPKPKPKNTKVSNNADKDQEEEDDDGADDEEEEDDDDDDDEEDESEGGATDDSCESS